MKSHRPNSTTIRRACFAYWRYQDEHGRWVMDCQECGSQIVPARDKWDADHDIVRAEDGSDEPPNVRPLCKHCHNNKTKKDVRSIAKGKRQSDSVYGVRRSRSRLGKREGMHYDWEQRRYVPD